MQWAGAEAEARLGMGRELPVAELGPSMPLLKRKRRSASPMARPPQLEASDSAQQLPVAAGPASSGTKLPRMVTMCLICQKPYDECPYAGQVHGRAS